MYAKFEDSTKLEELLSPSGVERPYRGLGNHQPHEAAREQVLDSASGKGQLRLRVEMGGMRGWRAAPKKGIWASGGEQVVCGPAVCSGSSKD